MENKTYKSHNNLQVVISYLYCVTIPKQMRYLNIPNKLAKKSLVAKNNNTKEVTFEPNRNSFNVNKKSTYIALMDETTNKEWKFFNFDDVNHLAIFYYLFDQSVKKELVL
jgi:hypothetical protein